MPVVLIDPARRYTTINHDQWCAIGKFDPVLEGSREIRDTTELLESVLPQAIEQWMQIGNQMSREPSSILAHTPACAMNNTDFGIMLAWSILVQHWISESRTTLVLCRDPWLFRHLAGHPGISAGKAPSLWPTLIRLWLRGFAARFKTCLKMAVEHIRRRSTRSQFPTAARVLLVYGHPQSDATGNDGYFGNLLNDFPELVRLTHVDCSATRNNELAADGRTFSLHAWGGLSGIVGLLFAKWRPSEGLRNGPLGWLVQRAASVEGSTGQGAMLSWQIHCQKNWMGSCFPRVVAWPWENHSWERELVRVASKLKVSTIGYQHATIGRWEVNYKIASNPDGLLSIPERILTCGQTSTETLCRWGYPATRIEIAGALRFDTFTVAYHDPGGPVYMALPFDRAIAEEMIEAAQLLGEQGHTVLIKVHPMAPIDFRCHDGMSPTDEPLSRQKGIAAVVYSGTTLGLEAMMMGLPTIRFRPRSRIAPDIIPDGIRMVNANQASLHAVLQTILPPETIDRNSIFAPPNEALWRDRLGSGLEPG